MAIDPQRAYPRSGEHMSVEEYFRLDSTVPDKRYEYHGGIIRLMSGGTKAHDDIAFNTRVALRQHFQSGPCSVQGSDMRAQVARDFYYYPDVTVTCDVADRRRDTTVIRSPRVVVEVLSPSTESFDRIDKMQKYQACPTIQEIVLISQFAQHVEVFRRNKHDDARWSSIAYGPEEVVLLNSLDLAIPIDEIYVGIDFDEPLFEE